MLASTAARWFWILLVIILFGIGGATVLRTLRLRPPTIEGPFSTTEIYLSPLASPGVSAKLLRTIDDIPPAAPMLFIGWGQDPTFVQTYYSVSYLTLPHRLGVVGCGISGSPPTSVRPPGTTADPVQLGGVLCYILPCSPAREITPELQLSYRKDPVDSSSWLTFCSP